MLVLLTVSSLFYHCNLPRCVNLSSYFYQAISPVFTLVSGWLSSCLSKFELFIVVPLRISFNFMFVHSTEHGNIQNTSNYLVQKPSERHAYQRPKFWCRVSDTSGQVSETYQLDWSRVYSIFDNNDLSDL